jgi:hypothetical protein
MTSSVVSSPKVRNAIVSFVSNADDIIYDMLG